MELGKSSRHPKITGDFAEYLVLYWLSKHKFECARVDHTGIDLIARNPKKKKLMGISVKSRSRMPGQEHSPLNVRRKSLPEATKACNYFKCEPYFALVIDAGPKIYGYLLSMEELEKQVSKGPAAAWKMRAINIEQYKNNPRITSFEFNLAHERWWQNS